MLSKPASITAGCHMGATWLSLFRHITAIMDHNSACLTVAPALAVSWRLHPCPAAPLGIETHYLLSKDASAAAAANPPKDFHRGAKEGSDHIFTSNGHPQAAVAAASGLDNMHTAVDMVQGHKTTLQQPHTMGPFGSQPFIKAFSSCLDKPGDQLNSEVAAQLLPVYIDRQRAPLYSAPQPFAPFKGECAWDKPPNSGHTADDAEQSDSVSNSQSLSEFESVLDSESQSGYISEESCTSSSGSESVHPRSEYSSAESDRASQSASEADLDSGVVSCSVPDTFSAGSTPADVDSDDDSEHISDSESDSNDSRWRQGSIQRTEDDSGAPDWHNSRHNPMHVASLGTHAMPNPSQAHSVKSKPQADAQNQRSTSSLTALEDGEVTTTARRRFLFERLYALGVNDACFRLWPQCKQYLHVSTSGNVRWCWPVPVHHTCASAPIHRQNHCKGRLHLDHDISSSDYHCSSKLRCTPTFSFRDSLQFFVHIYILVSVQIAPWDMVEEEEQVQGQQDTGPVPLADLHGSGVQVIDKPQSGAGNSPTLTGF